MTLSAIMTHSLALVVLAACCHGSGAQEVDYSLIDSASPANGAILAEDERCQECHGTDGNIHANNEASKIPKLAGQQPHYLLKQFNDFRSGARKHDFMEMMAKTVDDETAADIFAHYSQQPVMKGTVSKNTVSKNTVSKDNPVGKSLFFEGDAARHIQACVDCHGSEGRGLAAPEAPSVAGIDIAFIPYIGGQDWHYLNQQLYDWRSGERSNSQGGIMNHVTKQLSDAEIQALTDFIAGL